MRIIMLNHIPPTERQRVLSQWRIQSHKIRSWVILLWTYWWVRASLGHHMCDRVAVGLRLGLWSVWWRQLGGSLFVGLVAFVIMQHCNTTLWCDLNKFGKSDSAKEGVCAMWGVVWGCFGEFEKCAGEKKKGVGNSCHDEQARWEEKGQNILNINT